MTNERSTIGSGSIVTACDILGGIKTNAELESLLLEVGLSDLIPSGGTIAKTLLSIKEFAVTNPKHRVQTELGERNISVFLVEEAIRRFGGRIDGSKPWEKLERYLNLDGYALLKERSTFGLSTIATGFTTAMPSSSGIHEAASEVEQLLSKFGFAVAKTHLNGAMGSLAQGQWEASNGQCRTFLEALTDAIADELFPAESAEKGGGLEKRQLLAEKGFLSRVKHEFGDGNKQTFLPGLVKLLHPDGAHPGITTLHDASFRLQLVTVTARWLLKRLEEQAEK